MHPLLESTSMDDLETEDKAKHAIRHTLNQVRSNPAVSEQIGFGTDTFALLTEAAASLWDEPVETVREHFRR